MDPLSRSEYDKIEAIINPTQGMDATLLVSGHQSDVVLEFRVGTDPNWYPYPQFVSTPDAILFPFRTVPEMRIRLSEAQDDPWNYNVIYHTKAVM